MVLASQKTTKYNMLSVMRWENEWLTGDSIMYISYVSTFLLLLFAAFLDTCERWPADGR